MTVPASAQLINEDTGEEVGGTVAVTERIKQITGLTQDQFSRTMMIAQGEFLKILNAKSDDRKELFQRLFGTERFEDFQLRLKELYSTCESERNDIDTRILANAANIEAEDDYERKKDIEQFARKDAGIIIWVLKKMRIIEQAEIKGRKIYYAIKKGF